VFAVVVQAEFMYCPAVQTVQSEHEPALVVVLYVLPATHEGQSVSAVVVQVDFLYFPFAQTVHAVHEAALLVVL
jgi:hypothetical protein